MRFRADDMNGSNRLDTEKKYPTMHCAGSNLRNPQERNVASCRDTELEVSHDALRGV